MKREGYIGPSLFVLHGGHMLEKTFQGKLIKDIKKKFKNSGFKPKDHKRKITRIFQNGI